MYGPAYLLLARPIVLFSSGLMGRSEVDQWRLVNFLTFVLGVVFLYLFSLRWLSPGAACFTALLYATQPVLWGHAFINPKDTPFITFFILAIYTSFKFVDAISAGATPMTPSEAAVRDAWPRFRRIILLLGVLGLLALLVFIGLAPWLRSGLAQAIQAFYDADPATLPSRLFSRLAPNAAGIPPAAYIQKGLALFARMQKLILFSCLPLVIAAVLVAFFPTQWIRFFIAWETGPHGPLPRLPYVRRGDQLSVLRAALPLALLAGAVVGVSTTLRILAPLAALLAFIYFLLRFERRPLLPWLVYGLAALLSMVLAWPFLWDAPLARFGEVLAHMSYNPKQIPVLFDGVVYSSTGLPTAYLPKLLAITLSEPVWPLVLIGLCWLGFAWWRSRPTTQENKGVEAGRSWLPLLGWFGLPLAYVLLLHPPMYDGYRHFLFILPPVFIFAGLGYQALRERIHSAWVHALLLAAFILPGFFGLLATHPYQYAYYNSLVGGLGGAYRRFETDYWLTCYKELLAQANQEIPGTATIFVRRNPTIAAAYAANRFTIEPFDPDADVTFPGSLLLLTTRSNVDLATHPSDPLLLQVGRDGAVFCLIREVK